ncbi:RAB, putative [Entamoeba invadens IP1]|uniref:RAB, putative n=1 Tax=Entamoeba invadens IP1 TaxID=370355 RepID=A0A0A1TW17_ENTIV|nr:RAB, putative [Entamoeba invadens IP1]ELP84719.1 RAB, putative [Entamoeba invadens IP1]|eukprot:XP_004184065.1 RAB, putative [Entamoeba invadens IP1]
MQLSSTLKICLVGDMSVGKTCVVNRLVKDKFTEEEKATIAASFVTTTLTNNVTNKKVDVSIWAGQEKYRSMVNMYYRGSSGGVIVFDLTSKNSFLHVRSWYKDLKEAVPDVAVALIGNKSDASNFRVIQYDEAKALAEELKIDIFYEVSAKTGDNIKVVFEDLLKNMKPREKNEANYLEHHQLEDKQDQGCC